ncbi:hypothetical protein [Helicobacter felis]|nr:hypothetical protein [Helicobacter felis]
MQIRVLLKALIVLLEGLHAESDGFYAQVGFQYSNITQDNATSKVGTQVVQTPYKTVRLDQAFPSPIGTNWLAPSATDVKFTNQNNDNPATKRIQNLKTLVDWDGKTDINAAKTGYE